jgi:hypothetical protein
VTQAEDYAKLPDVTFEEKGKIQSSICICYD